jgi:DNA modification methylase
MNAIVIDCFGGTGTTLSPAMAMELDPKYCDVIIKRWQDFTGQEATLEGDGRTYAEITAQREGKAAA